LSDRFEKHAWTVTLLTLVSRVTGLARDAALARIFGISAVMDAFWFAFAIPNLFRRLFGEGALSAAFLPQYTRLDRDDPTVARQLATLMIAIMIVALGGLTIAGEAVLLVISAARDHQNLAVRLTMIMLPYMPMVCLVAVLGAMLQVHGRFGPTASAPIVLNLFIVTAAIGGELALRNGNAGTRGERHVMIVSLSVLAAGLVQVTWSLIALRHWKWWAGGLAACRQALDPMKNVLWQALPMFIGLGVLQINTFIDDLIASYPTTIGPTIFGIDFPLLPGALTAINNAQRLHEFPLGVFGIAVATAIFPTLSRAANDPVMFVDILRRGLRLVVFIGLPASVGLILVREPLTAAVFQGGDFTPEDTARVARVLMGFAPAIWAYSMTHTLTRAFYARGDSMTPVKVAVGMVALNFGLNVTLIWTPLKEAGLAWSTSTCAILQVMILLRLTRRHAPRVVDRSVATSWLRTTIVTAAMGAAVWIADALLTAPMPLAGTWRWAMIELLVLVGAGAMVVLIASVAMRMPELRWALGKR
jgi:putative peptidoglycan lipid II flippase